MEEQFAVRKSTGRPEVANATESRGVRKEGPVGSGRGKEGGGKGRRSLDVRLMRVVASKSPFLDQIVMMSHRSGLARRYFLLSISFCPVTIEKQWMFGQHWFE